MAADLILAIDQGTSSTKCQLVDAAGRVVAKGSAPLGETCPRPGWVEQDPQEIWRSIGQAVAAAFETADPARVLAVGFSTQRESLMLWDRRTGLPVSPLLSWQDQRTASIARRIGTPQVRARVRAISGLPLDPMFSALKASWLLDTYDPDRRRARAGELALGTVDSWCLWKLGGKHLIEIGNASRTQLLDTRKGAWSAELCDLFGVPIEALPQIVASVGPFPAIRGIAPLADGTPVTAFMGDSHASLFGNGAFRPGVVKATFGTGSSVMGLIGNAGDSLDDGTCLTIAWQIGEMAFAAEGNIRSAGATLRWLAEIFGCPVEALVAEGLAAGGDEVHLVPAFNGLGAPYWDEEAIGLIAGFKLGTRRGAIARAAVESIPHQVADVVESVERTIGHPVSRLYADGGPATNDGLMQLQADLGGLDVERSPLAGLSSIGAAHLAGLSAGLWTIEGLEGVDRHRDRFAPVLGEAERIGRRRRWADAVRRARLPARAAEDEAARVAAPAHARAV